MMNILNINKYLRLSICMALLLVLGLTMSVSGQSKRSFSNRDKKQIRELQRLSDRVYDAGMELYNQKKFWDAAQEMIVIIDYFPEYTAADKVQYYVGECLRELEINGPSQRIFKWVVAQHPESEFASRSLLSLQKIAFLDGKYRKSLTFYYALLKKYSESAALQESRYYAGQSLFYLKKFDQAIVLLQQIDGSSHFYDYAQYSAGLCMLKKRRVELSRNHLLKVAELPIISRERRRIVDDARLTIGFIYYEMGYLEEAKPYFEMISESHPYYMQALLGRAWAMIQVGEIEKAIPFLEEITEKYPKSGEAEEAWFLIGQSYMKLNRYTKAIKAYNKLIEYFPRVIDYKEYMEEINSELAQKQRVIEQLETELLLQESLLIDAIPLEPMGKQPPYIEAERKKVEGYRTEIVDKVLAERENLRSIRNAIVGMREDAERHYMRKDWRGYAEYGRARALYLLQID